MEMRKQSIIVPNPNLVLPKPPIDNKSWLGKEPYPNKSEMETRLRLKKNH